jgi:plastocyanin domain-containing protein
MRNEYESKIYELTEDINFLNRQLKQKEIDLALNRDLVKQNENIEIIQELNEKNQSLINQLKSVSWQK